MQPGVVGRRGGDSEKQASLLGKIHSGRLERRMVFMWRRSLMVLRQAHSTRTRHLAGHSRRYQEKRKGKNCAKRLLPHGNHYGSVKCTMRRLNLRAKESYEPLKMKVEFSGNVSLLTPRDNVALFNEALCACHKSGEKAVHVERCQIHAPLRPLHENAVESGSCGASGSYRARRKCTPVTAAWKYC